MKAIIFNMATILAAGITLCSCEVAFLDEKQFTDPGGNTFFTENKDYETAVYAIYSTMSNGSEWGVWGRGLVVAGEIGTDEMYAGSINQVNILQLETYSAMSGDNQTVEHIWRVAYAAINRANLVINTIDGLADPTDFHRSIRGEAAFLRALAYFNLVKNFGGVQYKVLLSQPDDNFDIPRSKVEDIYDLMIDDLEYAVNSLPGSQQQLGRATSLSAMAILSKVYLFMASHKRHNVITGELKLGDINSYDWVDEIDAYTKAKDWAKTVLDLLGGEADVLMADFAHAFYPYENSKEALFEVQYSSNQTADQGSFLPSLYGPQGESRLGGGQNTLHPLYCELFEGDKMTLGTPRFKRSICDYRLPPTYASGYSETYLTNSYSWTGGKFKLDPNHNYPYNKGPHNYPVIRSSEVCLIYSEALAELEGVSDAAFKYVNIVRARSRETSLSQANFVNYLNNPDIPLMRGYVQPTSDIEWFRLVIMNERKWELLGEGHRWYDLVRMGLLVKSVQAIQQQNEDYMNSSNATDKNKAYPGTRRISNYHVLRPLPNREIELTHRALRQNYGYR
ncbi:membrane protein [Bacteroidia bacterium]|nr:membrane protein [Bacteroidia bacterium]